MAAIVPAADIGQAAGVLVRSALGLTARERLVVIADGASAELGRALEQQGQAVGALVTVVHLDDVRKVPAGSPGRPLGRALPDGVRRSLLAAQACAFVATAPPEEHRLRHDLRRVVAACGLRHAHLPGLGPRSFVAALRSDLGALRDVSERVLALLQGTTRFQVESAAGTQLTVRVDDGSRWVRHLGVASEGGTCVFPSGVLYMPVREVEGVYVANASLGEALAGEGPSLLRKPVRLAIVGGHVAAVEGAPALEALLQASPLAGRVAFAALGLHAPVRAPTTKPASGDGPPSSRGSGRRPPLPSGDPRLDVTLPGLHLVLGDPLGGGAGTLGLPDALDPSRAPKDLPPLRLACGATLTVTTRSARLVEGGYLTA